MSSLQIRPGHRLLRCPLCRSGFTAAAGALVCRDRHSFDLAREGYINLLHNGRRCPTAGDDPAQLRYRAEFLAAGHFAAVATAIAGHVGLSAHEPWRVLDAGCGTGHHLAGIAAATAGPVVGLGLDISKDAVRQTARRLPMHAFAVADLWAEWPVRDAAFDLVVSIFAPKNFAETVRVLRPGGWLALAHPRPDHLVELRGRFGLIRQREDAARRYGDLARRFIGPPCTVRLRSSAMLGPAAVRAAVLMGPNARHVDPQKLDAAAQTVAVTFDINLLFARKPWRAS